MAGNSRPADARTFILDPPAEQHDTLPVKPPHLLADTKTGPIFHAHDPVDSWEAAAGVTREPKKKLRIDKRIAENESTQILDNAVPCENTVACKVKYRGCMPCVHRRGDTSSRRRATEASTGRDVRGCPRKGRTAWRARRLCVGETERIL
jgi:hypothetical protein